ncbi:HlyD family secretion protein [Roseovarius sp. 2305UL8-3]|uniref:HlyD family secretion protein n=1 Tax=Roseovarius conchicola TaxID=3121636 RepID=UPI00352990AA
MLELLATSFPVVIQYFLLKRRGETMTLWNMKTALFLWLAMAFMLFLTIFYFHPKSYSGLLPFRTISVVSQTTGPVTEILVENGQTVSSGDVLFRIKDDTQRAALVQAEAQFASITAAEAKAADSLKLAQAVVSEAEASLAQLQDDLGDQQQLLSQNVVSKNVVEQLQLQVTVAEAELDSATIQRDLAQVDIDQTLPAQRKAAEAAVDAAKVELDKTEVKTFSDGVVTQLALSVGSPASSFILSPAMVIIPKRPEGQPLRITAGFSQVARGVMYEGMPAEIACDSNVSMSFKNAVLPARIVAFQPAIAAGQVVPGGKLLEAENGLRRGSVLAYFELNHKEHEAIMLDGSGCIVQTYTNNMDGFVGHMIGVTGVVKAVGLRLKVWGVLLAGVGLTGGGH